MTAEEHNKTLSTLYFIYGAMHGLTLVALLLLVFVVKLAVPDAPVISSLWVTIAVVTFVALLIIVGVLPLLVGFGFKNRSHWLKPSAQVLAVISLVNIPIGTALGVYTIKFFRSEGGIRLYGGKTSSTTDSELRDAMRGAQPLMNLAKKVKQ